MSAKGRVRIRPGPPLQWRTWGDESVIFNPASGDTHVLDTVAGEALQCLHAQACDAALLTTVMASRFDVPVDGALEVYVARLLAQLDDLGLVEAVTE